MRKRLDHDPPSLTRLRDEAKLSKADLARALRCSRSLITEYEDGTRNANEDRIAELAKVLGCEAADLRARDESGRETATSPDEDLRDVRDGERAQPVDMPELRDGDLGQRNAS